MNEAFRREKNRFDPKNTEFSKRRLWKIPNSSRSRHVLAARYEADRTQPRPGGLAREELYRLVRAFELIVEVDTSGFKPVPNWEPRLVSSIRSKERDVLEVQCVFRKRVMQLIKVRPSGGT
jgi:hypothetical protein